MASPFTAAVAAIPVGQAAPDFTLVDQNKQPVSLSDFQGRKNVVLVFYPWAFTRTCGTELFAIRDELPTLQNDDVQVLTVSVDSVYSHRVWAERDGFEFPLLSDFWPHGDVARAYGVFDAEVGVALRGTFIIDREGIVRWRVVNEIPDARDLGVYQSVLATL
ncbi:MAG: mycoredoxin-dependent peroxiredoxin [Frankiales bacterium]|nr:mycoredoxin-dependent peroxiredoxin [Frankiales bacterium]